MKNESEKSSKKLGLLSLNGFLSHATEAQFEELANLVAAWAENAEIDHLSMAYLLVSIASLECYSNWKETAASPTETMRACANFYMSQLMAIEKDSFEGNHPLNSTLN